MVPSDEESQNGCVDLLLIESVKLTKFFVFRRAFESIKVIFVSQTLSTGINQATIYLKVSTTENKVDFLARSFFPVC